MKLIGHCLRLDISEWQTSLDRSELADALFHGEALGSPTGESRTPSCSNVAHINVLGGVGRRGARRGSLTHTGADR
jgi:hypothetical protein